MCGRIYLEQEVFLMGLWSVFPHCREYSRLLAGSASFGVLCAVCLLHCGKEMEALKRVQMRYVYMHTHSSGKPFLYSRSPRSLLRSKKESPRQVTRNKTGIYQIWMKILDVCLVSLQITQTIVELWSSEAGYQRIQQDKDQLQTWVEKWWAEFNRAIVGVAFCVVRCKGEVCSKWHHHP